MKTRFFGRSAVQVSEMGLGLAQLSNTDGAFPGVPFVPRAEADRILRFAIENGVTFFDAGDNYGNTECLVGDLPPTIKRGIFLATKAGLRMDGKRDFSSAYLLGQMRRSCERLRVERIDLFQLNKPSMNDFSDGRLFDLLNEMKNSGQIRYAGIIIGDEATMDLCVNSPVVDGVQMMWNLLFPPNAAFLERASERGVAVIARSPLNSGVLSGTYTPQTRFMPNDERSEYFSGEPFHRRLEALRGIQTDGGISDENLLEFSLAFLLAHEGISTIIPGASSVSQIERYIAFSRMENPPKIEIEKITKIVARYMKRPNIGFEGLIP